MSSEPGHGPRFQDHQQHFQQLVERALAGVDPRALVRSALDVTDEALVAGSHRLALHQDGRVYLIAFGKAAVPMTETAADLLGDRLFRGLAAVPAGTDSSPPESVHYLEGGHPLPSEGSLRAGAAARDLLAEVQPEDRVLVLISGGGSAMFELPVEGVQLDDLRSCTQRLLVSGAPVADINTVRKTLSQVKGGGLARLASPAPVLALVLSDVVGDRLAAVASGPTAIEPLNPAAARAVLERYELWDQASASIQAAVSRPGSGGPPMYRPINRLIGGNRQALEAAHRAAEELDFAPRKLTTTMAGEAGQLGRNFAEKLQRAEPGSCLLQGGEATVAVRGQGHGGPMLELALAAALELAGAKNRALLAFTSDGLDGPTDAAGAVVSGDTLAALGAAGVDPQARLHENDSYTALAQVDALLKTGRTHTNVNDIVVGLAYRGEGGSG